MRPNLTCCASGRRALYRYTGVTMDLSTSYDHASKTVYNKLSPTSV